MTEEGKIKQTLGRYAWNITLNTNEKIIIFCSNNFYLTENNGNVLGDKKNKEKWIYCEVEGDSYYFKCQKKIQNNILSIEKEEIKANKNHPGDTEKFELIYVDNIESNDNNSETDSLSQNINDKYEEESLST